ncbi:hypothetical protein EDB84DRAFT_1278327 [Lactarius hengduanensis]|nr:hypothetical protein EDB84DRAFT_1278327 [Lactarius hengduanensis]
MSFDATAQSTTTSADRPDRNRNAKAQVRHRAKRKAYIEQLERAVTKPQTVLALSLEQVAALPPPTLHIRELDQENPKLLSQRGRRTAAPTTHAQIRRPSFLTDHGPSRLLPLIRLCGLPIRSSKGDACRARSF